MAIKIIDDIPGDGIRKILGALHQVIDKVNTHTHGGAVPVLSGTNQMINSGSATNRFTLVF